MWSTWLWLNVWIPKHYCGNIWWQDRYTYCWGFIPTCRLCMIGKSWFTIWPIILPWVWKKKEKRKKVQLVIYVYIDDKLTIPDDNCWLLYNDLSWKLLPCGEPVARATIHNNYHKEIPIEPSKQKPKIYKLNKLNTYQSSSHFKENGVDETRD